MKQPGEVFRRIRRRADRFLETTPGVRFAYWHLFGRFRAALERRRLASRPAGEIFREIYAENKWNDPESRSGTGSNLRQTETIRLALPALFRKYGIRSIADIPCGDFHWMSHVDLSGISYFGGDIVPELVAANIAAHQKDQVRFGTCNLLTDKIPPVDLLIVRDCLVHFSFHDIFTALRIILDSGPAFLLTTTFRTEPASTDIATGQWRRLNLEIPPFNFPPPIEALVENCDENDAARSKCLCLWCVADLRDRLKLPCE